jgi:DNA glycosylase AlkZ-like
MGIDERRARLGVRHHLARGAKATDPVDVARDLVAVHGTDSASVFIGLAARLRSPAVSDIERALYDERRLVRMLGMRRTMFVLPVEDAGVVHGACTRAIAERERRQLIRMLEGAGVARDAARWLRDVEASTLRALERRGEATAAELSSDEPRLATQLRIAVGKAYEGSVGVSTRVLFLLSAEGRVVRGRPRGSWISSQYRWSPIDAWVPGGMPELRAADAQAALVRRWLQAFGPGTVADLRWWTGLTTAAVKAALTTIRAVEVDLEDAGSGVVLPDDLDPVPRPRPWVALLPALDTSVMAWSERAWFLGDHGRQLFDRNGNAGPTAWSNGRVVGGWAQRPDGEVVVRLLRDVGSDAARQLEREAERLRTWLGRIRVTARFRTPLERELVADA